MRRRHGNISIKAPASNNPHHSLDLKKRLGVQILCSGSTHTFLSEGSGSFVPLLKGFRVALLSLALSLASEESPQVSEREREKASLDLLSLDPLWWCAQRTFARESNRGRRKEEGGK